MQQQWRDTYPDGCFFSNQEIIDNPQYKPPGWFNPFTELDKLGELLKNFTTSAQIKKYLEQFYPGIDPAPYVKKKISANKKRDIKYCGRTWVKILDPEKQKYINVPKRCKHWNDCPLCRQWKIEQAAERLKVIRDKRIIICETKAEENIFKLGLTKKDYLRVIRADGTVALILNEAPQDVTEQITPQLIDELSREMLPNEALGRFSGKLGEKIVVKTDDSKHESQEEIEVISCQVRFTEESTINNNKELDEAVEKELSIPPEMPKDVTTLRFIVQEIDKALDIVCIRHKIDKQFLNKVAKYISMSQVQWRLLPQRE